MKLFVYHHHHSVGLTSPSPDSFVDGPNVPLEVVDILPVDRSKVVEGPVVLAEGAAGVLLELNPTNEFVDGLSVYGVLETELVGEESGV